MVANFEQEKETYQQDKQEFFKRLRENKGNSYIHGYSGHDVTHLELGFKSSWKELRAIFVKLLKSKKESHILFNGWYFEREKEYKYPDKETMYKYYGLEEYYTGKHQIKIWKKDSFPLIYIYEKDFLK